MLLFLWVQDLLLGDHGLKLDVAMGMYGLEHSELFWERLQDTKLLLAWSDSCILLAFRGTASLANALADVQESLQPNAVLRRLSNTIRRRTGRYSRGAPLLQG